MKGFGEGRRNAEAFGGGWGKVEKDGVHWVTYVRVGGLAPVPHPNRREGKRAGEGGGACRTGRNSAGKSDKSVNFVASVRFLCYIGIVKKEINRRRVLLWIRNC